MLVPGGEKSVVKSVVASRKNGRKRTVGHETYPSQPPQDHEVQPD